MSASGENSKSYVVDMVKLREVEENFCVDSGKFSLLSPKACDDRGLSKQDIGLTYHDYMRNLSFKGTHSNKVNPLSEDEFAKFLESEKLSPLVTGYVQDTSSPVDGFLMKFQASFNQMSLFMSAKCIRSDGTVFSMGNSGIGIIGVAKDIKLSFEVPQKFSKEIKKLIDSTSYMLTHTIPGETFVRAKVCDEGGYEVQSMRVSNQLLKGLLEYTPIRKRAGTDDADDDTLTFSPLIVYGIEIINGEGVVNHLNLQNAILSAQLEEDAIKAELESAHKKFEESVAGNQDLKKVLSLTKAHLISRDDLGCKYSDKDYNATTIDSAMAIAIFRDLPPVLNRQKNIADCPALLDAIVWCGVPELSAAIRGALQPVIGANPDSLEKAYGVGDSTADLAQAYYDAVQKKESGEVIDGCADLLLNFSMNSSDEVLKECEKYKITELEEVKELQESQIKQKEGTSASDKVQTAIAMKMLMEKVKTHDDYKKKRQEQLLENEKLYADDVDSPEEEKFSYSSLLVTPDKSKADNQYEEARDYYERCLNAYEESVVQAASESRKEFDVNDNLVIRSGKDFLMAADSAVKEGNVNKDNLITIFNFQAQKLHDCMGMLAVQCPKMPASLAKEKPNQQDCENAINNLAKQNRSLAGKAFVAVGVLLGVTAVFAGALALSGFFPPAGLAFLSFMAPVAGPTMLTATTAAIATLGYVASVAIGCKIEDSHQERGLKACASKAVNSEVKAKKKAVGESNITYVDVSDEKEVNNRDKTSIRQLLTPESDAMFSRGGRSGTCKNDADILSDHALPIGTLAGN